MAMTIFYLLNGMGVIFLLYVLANFWNAGHRPKNDAPKDTAASGRGDRDEVIVVTHPISHFAQGGLSVISFQGRDRQFGGKPARRTTAPKATEMPARQISTR
jgi:hypothetical protein